jgi:hypothetical protein
MGAREKCLSWINQNEEYFTLWKLSLLDQSKRRIFYTLKMSNLGSMFGSQFSATFANLWQKNGVFFINQCYDHFLANTSSSLSKKRLYFCKNFRQKYFKSITPVPGSIKMKNILHFWKCPTWINQNEEYFTLWNQTTLHCCKTIR